ncbi:hypothetical protein [Roseivirga sp.]|uniref:hypothetical protein n=1 Tax=Roseivirga sp. TaxID=1964215 RepID=UPI002B272729|nr:hypothetical protein [Roseivirga sp.]
MMKNLTKAVLVCLMVTLTSTAVRAQGITDQDMKDYAIIMLAQKAITDKISPYVNDLIEKQDGIDGNRYAELDAAAKGDISKLPADATDFEKQFYGIVQKRVKDRTDAAGVVVNSLAKYSLGASAYNAVKKAYASGGDTKSKIDAMMAQLVSEKP